MINLLQLIKERQSVRGLFDPDRPIAQHDLKQILEAGSWAPTAHNMQNFEIVVVEDQNLLESIGNIKYPISQTFIRENYDQLSFSEEELCRKKTGILSTRFPANMTRPTETPQEIYNDFLAKSIQSSAAMLIVIYDPSKRAPASEGDFLGIISLGCVMENMWLMAHSLGIGLHIVSSLSGDPVEKEVKNLLNIPEHLIIAFSCRLGYPVSVQSDYLRVRRNIEDFTHVNRFGNKGLT
jgi:nitroreductase